MSVSRAVLAAGLVLGACSDASLRASTTPGGDTARAQAMVAGERVVILGDGGDDEASGLECIRAALSGQAEMPAGEFRRALFPWFEPGIAPNSEAELAARLAVPLVRDRIATLGVRYLLTGGMTTSTTSLPGGTAVIGVIGKWRRTTLLTVKAWDLTTAAALGTVSAGASGEGAAGVVVFVPILTATPTESTVCAEAKSRVAELFGKAPR
jgi:hypothetical protein